VKHRDVSLEDISQSIKHDNFEILRCLVCGLSIETLESENRKNLTLLSPDRDKFRNFEKNDNLNVTRISYLGKKIAKIKRISVSLKKLIHGEEHLGVNLAHNNISINGGFNSPIIEPDREMKAGIRYLRNLGQKRRIGVISPIIKENRDPLLKIQLPNEEDGDSKIILADQDSCSPVSP
jgi:hypothetical protein